MPTYDYRCETNNQIVEVNHSIHLKVETWGELCKLAGIPPDNTPLSAAVTRLITGGSFNNISEQIKLDSILPK